MISDLKLVSIKNVQSKSSLKKFDCGIDQLNTFLSGYALKNDILGIGKTFVAFDSEKKIVGYFTLATAQVGYQEIPETFKAKLPKYPIPAIRIARLAVNQNYKGKGVGKWLLTQAFTKIVQVSDVTGVYCIVVDAKETSKTFYEYYGFVKFMDHDLTYFMLVDTVRKAMGI